MVEKIVSLIRFWELRLRHERQGAPLDARERAELLMLLDRVGALGFPERDPNEVKVGAAYCIKDGESVFLEIQAVGAGGLLVEVMAPNAPLRVNDRFTLRAADAISGIEYVIPCVVAWVSASSPTTLTLVVDGIPARTSFDGSAMVATASMRDDRDEAPITRRFPAPRPRRQFEYAGAARR